MSDEKPAPQFVHDCDACTFLGRYEWEKQSHDLYVCMQGRNWPTVIARFSSDGPDYMSGLEIAVQLEAQGLTTDPLVEAMRRAKASGHLTRKDTTSPWPKLSSVE